jgi:hypothetical protein
LVVGLVVWLAVPIRPDEPVALSPLVKLPSSVKPVVLVVATQPTTTVWLTVVADVVALGDVLVPDALAFLSSGDDVAALVTT